MIRRLTGLVRPSGAFAAAVLLVSVAAAPAWGDPTPAAPTRGAKPGTIVSSEPIDVPAGARGWRVVHRSRSVAGDAVVVSGLVLAPDGPAPRGGRPIVAWAHGTTGLADACAPSAATDPHGNVPWIDELLAAGYVVTATDYEGIGTPGIHPYLVGESEGRSVLDTVRAARRLPTGANRRVVVFGHSQGGHAALFAGEIAADYAPELRLVGVAPGAPVSDPAAFLALTERMRGAMGFVVMGVLGYQAAYPDLAAASLLRPEAAARAEVARTECAPSVFATFAGDEPETVLVEDAAVRARWDRRLRENAAGNRRAGAPVLLWQGDADSLTPDVVNSAYLPRACAQGSVVDYRRYPGADHGSVLTAAKDDVFAFIAARFAGAPPTSTCSRP